MTPRKPKTKLKLEVRMPGKTHLIGGGFQNTKELHVMKYKEAMSTPDRIEWEGAVKKEHQNKYTVAKGASKHIPMGL